MNLLLRRSAILEGESLQSYLTRLSILNHYPTHNTVEKMATQQAEPYTTAWFTILSKLTAQPELNLFLASYHRWADIFEPYPLAKKSHTQSHIIFSPEEKHSTVGTYARNYYLWKFTDITYCPDCLKKKPYHRLHWLPLTSAACLEHKILLVRGCPQCKQPIPIYNLVYGICKNCQFPLQEAPTTDVSHDEFGLTIQAMLQSLWGDVTGTFPATNMKFPNQMELKELYFFFEQLRGAVASTNGDISIYHNLDIVDNHIQMSQNKQEMIPAAFFTTCATAFKGLSNWPDGFYTFLDAFRHRAGRKLTGNYYEDFRGLILRLKKFEFAIQELYTFRLHHYRLYPSIPSISQHQNNEEFQKNFAYTTPDEAKALLQISQGLLDELVNLGLLTKQKLRYQKIQKGTEPPEYLLYKAEVISLSNIWKQGWSLSQTAEFMGISENNVVDLIDHNLIAHQKGSFNQESSDFQISIQSVVLFLAQIREASDDESTATL